MQTPETILRKIIAHQLILVEETLVTIDRLKRANLLNNKGRRVIFRKLQSTNDSISQTLEKELVTQLRAVAQIYKILLQILEINIYQESKSKHTEKNNGNCLEHYRFKKLYFKILAENLKRIAKLLSVGNQCLKFPVVQIGFSSKISSTSDVSRTFTFNSCVNSLLSIHHIDTLLSQINTLVYIAKTKKSFSKSLLLNILNKLYTP
jgi:hypothetical protein